MLSRLLHFLYGLALTRRRAIYAAFAVLVPLSLAFSTRLTVTTSQQALLKPDHPVQLEYREFVREFGAVDSLVAVLQSDELDAAAMRSLADQLAEAFRSRKDMVRNVFHRVDLAPMVRKAPYYAPLDTLTRAGDWLEGSAGTLAALDGPLSAEGALDLVSGAVKEGAAAGLDPSRAPLLAEAVAAGAGEWSAFLKDPGRALADPVESAFASLAASDPRAAGKGYLASRDGRMLFIFIQPANPGDDSKVLKPFLDEMRRSADQVLAARPEVAGRAAVGFTGSPAHVLTEAETVFDDVARGVMGAVALMMVIVFVGFRTVRKTVCLFVPLLCGMSLSLGAITLLVGRLNLISAAFFAVMFGMGMDFGIYLVRRAEEETGAGHALEEAVGIAVEKTGRGVFVGGLTTCAAFWGMSLTEFSGFSELGVTAGIGIFVCLSTVFLMIPSLMLTLGVEPRKADTGKVESRLAGPGAARVLRAVSVAVMALAVASALSARGNRFDYDALKLLPRDSESTKLQWRMQRESDFSANSAVVVADSLDEIRGIGVRLKESGEVSRVESLADLVPDGQAEKEVELARIRRLLAASSRRFSRVAGLGHDGVGADADPASRPVAADGVEGGREGAIQGGLTAEEVREGEDARGMVEAAASLEPPEARLGKILSRLDDVAEALADAQESAFSAGLPELSASLDHAIASVESLGAAMGKMPAEDALAGTDAFWSSADRALDRALGQVAAWTSARPVAEGDLDPSLLARFKSGKGRYVAYVFPESLVWDVEALDRFMAAVRQVAPSVTGFAATHQVFSRMVPTGFVQSMAFAFLALALMLFLDLRRPRAVAFALTPMVLGLVLLQGVLRLLGVDHNYASVAAYPVLLGYGSDYGVNVVHRWLERPKATAFVTAFTVGKGVLLSAATSVAGLFSIVFARHKGVADFGAVLLAGISMCLLTAVVFLPVLIDIFRPPEAESKAEGKKAPGNGAT